MRPLLAAACASVTLTLCVATSSAQESPAPLRLSEFSSNPPEAGNDGAYEWVEIENTSAAAVSLDGWSVGDSKTTDRLPAIAVPPGGFVLVTGDRMVAPPGVLSIRVADKIIGSGFNNDGDIVRLLDPSGRLVERVPYGTERQAESDGPAAPPAGRSAARTPDGTWRTSLEPSPGRPNVFPSAANALSGSSDARTDRAPVRFAAGNRMGTTSWIVLAALAGTAIAGVVEMAYRHRRRWRRAA